MNDSFENYSFTELAFSASLHNQAKRKAGQLKHRYYIRGHLPQTNGNRIPKWAYRIDDDFFSAESPHPKLGFDTKIEAEVFLAEVMRDRTMQMNVRGWQVVDELGNYVCRLFHIRLYWDEADRRERREQAIDHKFHTRWLAPQF